MKVFDYLCNRGCGRKFEVFVVSIDEKVDCPTCHLLCEKQPGGKPAKSHGDSRRGDYPSPSFQERGKEDAFVNRMMGSLLPSAGRDFECKNTVLAKADIGDSTHYLIAHTHVPKAKA